MDDILKTIKNQQLTFEQKIIELSRQAENTLNVLKIDDEVKYLIEKKIICDLYEGNAPYRPRYILPDYEKFMQNGSKFLRLNPPENLYEAVNNLLILYKHTPSITTFPVFLGNIDVLLEPFITKETSDFEIIKLFLTHIDRTLTDSFVHANIGPLETKAGKLILKAERELVNSIPNLTLKYDETTSDNFALEAILTGLKAAKPYFANHKMFIDDFGEKYGIASCYNGLPTGGGSFTLVRMNLKNLAYESKNSEHFFTDILPNGVGAMCRLMDQRIKFIVEESGFFESNFLVEEGLIDKNRFLAMFGIHGLAECVNYLNDAKDIKQKFGHSETANNLGLKILEHLEIEVEKHPNKYCLISGGKFKLHAQCGIGDDVNTSPGCRIPAGEEPETLEQILQASLYHKFFPTGISDIFTFDQLAEKNPQYILDIIKGAMKSGMRIFSFYTKDADLIRITGYLVKKSEIEKHNLGEKSLHDTVSLGAPTYKGINVEKRKLIKS
jgi:YjjI family glycine radical enzyme